MNGRSLHSIRGFLLLVVFLFNLASVPGGQISTTARQSETLYRVAIENGVSVKMRDGVLVADVYRPNVDGRFPVLIERTP